MRFLCTSSYGPTAVYWEVEELVRKLLLSAVVVLIQDGSPLQVTMAVLVSGWAHVLHSIYSPWGRCGLGFGLGVAASSAVSTSSEL